MNPVTNQIDVEIKKEYARLVAVLSGFEDEKLSDSDQLIHLKGLLGAQYAFLCGFMSEELHTDFIHLIYDKAGFNKSDKYRQIFED